MGLAKIIHGVNLINILAMRAFFCPYLFSKKSQSQTVITGKLCNLLLYKKMRAKMLIKILPGSTRWGSHRHPWGDAISGCNQWSEYQRPKKI